MKSVCMVFLTSLAVAVAAECRREREQDMLRENLILCDSPPSSLLSPFLSWLFLAGGMVWHCMAFELSEEHFLAFWRWPI